LENNSELITAIDANAAISWQLHMNLAGSPSMISST